MTAVQTVAQFDYSAIDADIASNLRKQASRIKKRIGKATQDLIDIGRDLLAAKEHLVDHGDFVKWVEAEVGIVRRTAQAYMAIAKLAVDKGAAVALLPPTTAHRLAAKSAPPEVVSEVVAKAQSGDVISDRIVFKMILDAKSQKKHPEQREQARQQKERGRQTQERKTSEAAELLLGTLSADGVALVVKVFSEEESPWDLLSVLSRRIGIAVKGSAHDVVCQL